MVNRLALEELYCFSSDDDCKIFGQLAGCVICEGEDVLRLFWSDVGEQETSSFCAPGWSMWSMF